MEDEYCLRKYSIEYMR